MNHHIQYSNWIANKAAVKASSFKHRVNLEGLSEADLREPLSGAFIVTFPGEQQQEIMPKGCKDCDTAQGQILYNPTLVETFLLNNISTKIATTANEIIVRNHMNANSATTHALQKRVLPRSLPRTVYPLLILRAFKFKSI